MHAASVGVPELLAEGYAEVVALGERLAEAEGLDARARDAVADWRAVHAEQAALADTTARRGEETAIGPPHREIAGEAEARPARPELPEGARAETESRPPHDAHAARLRGEIRGWPGRVRILLDDRPPDEAALDALTQWRERAEPLLQEALAMRRSDGPHALYLEAMPGERQALDIATRRLDAAVAAVEVAETRQLMRSAGAFEERGGGMRYDAPAYGPLMERVRALDARPYLPESWRKTVDAVLGYDERRRRGRQPDGGVLDAAAREDPGEDGIGDRSQDQGFSW